MTVINISEAKANLSKLIAQVEIGKEFVLARSGKPIARLTPLSSRQFPRVFKDEWKGAVKISDDFDVLPDDFLSHFS